MNEISKKIRNILEEINPEDVKIIAVTKYVGIDEIIDAYNEGIRNFGENKVQDALNKKENLPEEITKNSSWHLIGHLQTNKVKKAVGNFDIIHSVDSLKLARAISEEAKANGIKQNVLIQVNISSEESKYGFSTAQIKEVFEEVQKLDSLNIMGLMTMAPFAADETQLRAIFKELRELRDYLQNEFKQPLPELSMGMSNDYKIAIQEGATMIRLGSLIFK